MTFCQSCGKEFTSDENFCPGCGMQRFSQTQNAARPTGITVLGVLQIIAGIILVVFTAMIGTMSGMMSNSYFGAMMSIVGGAITAVLAVLQDFHF